MKRFNVIALTLLLFSVPPAFALTSETPPVQDEMVLKAGDPGSPTVLNGVAHGQVIATDDVLEFIKLKDQVGRVRSFYVDTNTPIYDEYSRPIAFSDLNAGNTVSLEYHPTSDTVAQIRRVKG